MLSQGTFKEIDEVLAREKFGDSLTLDERAAFIEALVDRCQFAEPTEEIRACRDPDDDKFLVLAVRADAACIVSGDADLQVLPPFRGIPILAPADFMDWVERDTQ